MSGQDFIRHVRNDPLAAHMPIILLTGNKDKGEKIAGFEAGTDDYLVKPVDPTELDLRVKALLTRASAAQTQRPRTEAKIITLFSLRGGVGTTSISINLAIALARLWGIDVPLLDFGLRNGHCALMLNLKPRYTISYLTEWDTPTVDVETLESLLLRHESGVRLLPAPVSPVEAELITPAVIDRIWPYLRASYPFLVVDGGSQLTETTLTALERSEAIVLLLSPDLASLKATVDTIHLFKQLGYHQIAEILPVINRTFPNDGLPHKDLQSALKYPVAGVIPYNRTAFVKAINSGRPHFTTNPTSEASLAIATLAYELSSTRMDTEEIANPSGLPARVRKLAKAA